MFPIESRRYRSEGKWWEQLFVDETENIHVRKMNNIKDKEKMKNIAKKRSSNTITDYQYTKTPRYKAQIAL